MSRDDDFDEELRRRLEVGAPPSVDPTTELNALRPRFRKARQRRQATVAALSSAAAICLVVVAVASLGGGDEQTIKLAVDPTPSTTTSTSTTSPAPTTAAPNTGSLPTTVPTTLPVTPVQPRPNPSGPSVTTTSAPPASVPASPTTTVAPARLETLTSEGGTADVSWSSMTIMVLSTSPAAGWELESVEQRDATRVVVKFRRPGGGSGSSSASIDARVVNGQLEVQ